MIELDIHNMAGEKVDSMEIDEAILGGTVNRQVIRQAILMYAACRRSGTAKVKNRSEVSGSRAKPFAQKHTGRARQGSWIAPQHRGGGIVFGPVPRSYRYSIPKKARLAALKSAYLDKLQTATHVLDQLKLEQPKTKEVARLLHKLNVRGTCLIATFAHSDAVTRSVRNIPGVSIKRIRDVSAYDLLAPRDFVVTRRALESVIERFSNEAASGGE